MNDKEIKNIPEIIYLQVDPDDEHPEDFKALEEVTWCSDWINTNDIKYMRQKWISVKDELPESPKAVLVCETRGSVRLMYYHQDKWNSVWGDLEFITHWMPLPEPPKE